MDYLMKFADGDQDFINEMLKTFVANTPDSVKNLKQLYLQKNWTQLSTELHKIKPTFRYLAVDIAEAKIKEAEHLCREDIRPEQIGKLLDDILKISEEVIDEVRSTLNQK